MTDKKLISSLQGLRAVAFLCVVISHCGAPWLGPWAISVFVALSGFLMVCNYYDRPRTAPGLQSAIAFSFKKIRRLYPLHLIMMAAALLFVLKGLLAQPSARGVLSCAAQLAVSMRRANGGNAIADNLFEFLLNTPAQNFDGFWLRLDFQRNIYSQQESLQRAFCTEP